MQKPPYGICVPCHFAGLRDGDTPLVRLRTGQQIAVRLIDCWCPEMSEAGGAKAKEFLGLLLDGADGELSMWVPLARDRNADGVVDVMEILAAQSFDRVPGRLFIGESDVGEIMVERGHATRGRPAAKDPARKR